MLRPFAKETKLHYCSGLDCSSALQVVSVPRVCGHRYVNTHPSLPLFYMSMERVGHQAPLQSLEHISGSPTCTTTISNQIPHPFEPVHTFAQDQVAQQQILGNRQLRKPAHLSQRSPLHNPPRPRAPREPGAVLRNLLEPLEHQQRLRQRVVDGDVVEARRRTREGHLGVEDEVRQLRAQPVALRDHVRVQARQERGRAAWEAREELEDVVEVAGFVAGGAGLFARGVEEGACWVLFLEGPHARLDLCLRAVVGDDQAEFAVGVVGVEGGADGVEDDVELLFAADDGDVDVRDVVAEEAQLGPPAAGVDCEAVDECLDLKRDCGNQQGRSGEVLSHTCAEDLQD